MNSLHALILGIVEGITEFLPISSTAHLILAGDLLHLPDDAFRKSFEIIIQLGAILSVVVLYWRKLLDVEVLKRAIVAFIPTGILGLALHGFIKRHLLGNIPVVLASLLIGGIVLVLFKRLEGDTRDEVDFTEITYRRALLIGLFQSIAMIPGVSRSAATIVGGSLIGVPKRTIVEFSFILAIPTMAAASGLELLKGYKDLAGHFDVLGIGFVVSFVTAIFAVKSFLGYVKRHSFAVFGWYRIVLSVVYYLVVAR